MARNHTPKPLYGAKKYSQLPQACTVSGCNEENWVSWASTPAKRRCENHFFNEPMTNKQLAHKLLLDIIGKNC